jgi:hypothetical protein
MKARFFSISILLAYFSCSLWAQENIQFSPEDLQSISKRWSKYHPDAEVFLLSGDTLTGQPVHFDMQKLLLYPSDSLPLNLEGKMLSIPFADIDRVSLNRGGPVTPGLASGIIIGIGVGIGIGAIAGSPGAAFILGNLMGFLGGVSGKAIQVSSTSAELKLKPEYLNYQEEITKLHEWSVFKDSVIYTGDINLLPVYSRAMRRLYPQKHFRITLGLNGGLNSLENDLQAEISSSGLPPPEEYYHSALGFEYLDFSWRFNHHWIIGGGFMKNQDPMASTYSYQEYGAGSKILDYRYSVNMTDFRIYTEYVLSPVNRFLTDRFEFLVGRGFIISRPKPSISYTYRTDSDTGDTDYGYFNETQTIFGLQARAACHLSELFFFGWSGNEPLSEPGDGCHTISLRRSRTQFPYPELQYPQVEDWGSFIFLAFYCRE